MTLHIDCSTCPGAPAACEGCSVALLLGPVVSLASTTDVTPVLQPDQGINGAIAAFAAAGMLPGFEAAGDRVLRAV